MSMIHFINIFVCTGLSHVSPSPLICVLTTLHCVSVFMLDPSEFNMRLVYVRRDIPKYICLTRNYLEQIRIPYFPLVELEDQLLGSESY